jgi:hypothetical protein
VALPFPAAADNGLTSKVIAPDFVIAGRTYGEWSAAWWQWATSIPVSSNPLFDNGDCTTGQTGQVFFLGGKFCSGSSCSSLTATRQCTVPSRKNIYFPIVNAVDGIPGPGDTINSFRKINQDTIDGTTKVEADLDGRRLDDLGRFRIQSSAFDFLLPDDNLFGILAGTYEIAADDGVYVMLQPLSPGTHLLHFTGTFAGGFSLDITYRLKVSP